MKKIIAALFVCMSVAPANADTFTWPFGEFYDDLADNAGAVCSTGGKRILVCNCAPGQKPYPKDGNIEDARCNLNMNLGYGCRFNNDLSVGWNRGAYCMDADSEHDACTACGCISDGTEFKYNKWQDIGSDRVSLVTEPVRSSYSQYYCTMETETHYGCAANYYQYAGDGESMTCSPCPDGGKNGIGTTKLSTCTLSKDNEMTDEFGTYKCSSDYVYK